MFASLFGAEAGNLALRCLAVGGVYLGGGIAPQILSILNDGHFLEGFTNKGRFLRRSREHAGLGRAEPPHSAPRRRILRASRVSASSYGIMPRLCLTTLILAHASGLDAQGIEDYARIRAGKRAEALRIDEPIKLDGRLDEPVWQARHAGSRVFISRHPARERWRDFPTEVRFLYDDTMLYVGAMLYDDEPDKLIVNELSRDFSARNNDFFGLVLDLFRDRENGLAFVCNPGGAMRDTQIYDNGRPDANWNGVWVCSTEILENGWSVEYAIPFKALPLSQRRSAGMGVSSCPGWLAVLTRGLIGRRSRDRTATTEFSDAGVLTGIRAPSSRNEPSGEALRQGGESSGGCPKVTSGAGMAGWMSNGASRPRWRWTETYRNRLLPGGSRRSAD